jgi:hypothetical protein
MARRSEEFTEHKICFDFLYKYCQKYFYSKQNSARCYNKCTHAFMDTPLYSYQGGPGSSVGIATELRAGRSVDRIPVGARFSAPVQTGPGTHLASCTMGTGSFPGVSGRGVTLTPHPLLAPRSWKSRTICNAQITSVT